MRACERGEMSPSWRPPTTSGPRIRHDDQPTYDAVAAKHGLVKILTNDERWLFNNHRYLREGSAFVRPPLPAAHGGVVNRWSSIRGGSGCGITYLQRIYAAA